MTRAFAPRAWPKASPARERAITQAVADAHAGDLVAEAQDLPLPGSPNRNVVVLSAAGQALQIRGRRSNPDANTQVGLSV